MIQIHILLILRFEGLEQRDSLWKELVTTFNTKNMNKETKGMRRKICSFPTRGLKVNELAAARKQLTNKTHILEKFNFSNMVVLWKIQFVQ